MIEMIRDAELFSCMYVYIYMYVLLCCRMNMKYCTIDGTNFYSHGQLIAYR
ncbi:hypothetical protein HanPSC8_Chr15g0655731 [Helianthus annuus]|nr:hypothetical protein HanPSC8_Chr15g0655731 [Helianthus annuus]